MARPSFQPTDAQRRQVEAMAGYGIPHDDIARVLTIDPKTLRKHFRDELATGATKATARVAESLYKKATGDGAAAVTAAIFWLKTRAGWKEPERERDAPDAPLGKKEQRQRDAEAVTGKFSPPQAPRLVVKNG